MTFRPVKLCQHPGCGRAAESLSSNRCKAHSGDATKARAQYDAQVRAQVPELRMAAEIRGKGQWKAVRRAFRDQYPLCCDPFNRHTAGPEPTAHVHHVFPLITHPHLAHDWDNLRPLCVPCHNEVEGLERKGQPTQGLFKVT